MSLAGWMFVIGGVIVSSGLGIFAWLTVWHDEPQDEWTPYEATLIVMGQQDRMGR